jgi:hypothetical protein
MKPTYAWYVSHMLLIQWWLRLRVTSQWLVRRVLFTYQLVLRYLWAYCFMYNMHNYTHNRCLVSGLPIFLGPREKPDEQIHQPTMLHMGKHPDLTKEYHFVVGE